MQLGSLRGFDICSTEAYRVRGTVWEFDDFESLVAYLAKFNQETLDTLGDEVDSEFEGYRELTIMFPDKRFSSASTVEVSYKTINVGSGGRYIEMHCETPLEALTKGEAINSQWLQSDANIAEFVEALFQSSEW